MNREAEEGNKDRKKRLRTRFRAYRHSLSSESYARLSTGVVQRALSLAEICGAKTVHVYWPLLERREIDTRPLVRWLESRGSVIVLPVVLDSGTDETPKMDHVRYSGSEGLRKNKWGIHEPTRGERVDVEALDAVVVPALGAGRNGHRIGYGRGFYDAFLARVDAPRICLLYDACLIESVPFEPHDVEMDVLVTEREILRCGRRGPSL